MIFSFPFLPPNPHICPQLFQTPNICIYTININILKNHIICIYVHINSPKYKHNLLSQYNITCMYVFKVSCSVFDAQLVCSSLGKTISAALSIP